MRISPDVALRIYLFRTYFTKNEGYAIRFGSKITKELFLGNPCWFWDQSKAFIKPDFRMQVYRTTLAALGRCVSIVFWHREELGRRFRQTFGCTSCKANYLNIKTVVQGQNSWVHGQDQYLPRGEWWVAVLTMDSYRRSLIILFALASEAPRQANITKPDINFGEV